MNTHVTGPNGRSDAVGADLSADPRADLLLDAARRAARYLAATGGPVGPRPASIEALDALDADLPDRGLSPDRVLTLLDEVGSAATVRSTGGRYFGFVNGGTEPAGLAAAVLASAWDQNAALPVMSPVAARLDAVAARWVGELLGLDTANPELEASFCAGASVANLTAVCAARDALLARAGWSVADDGLTGAPPIEVVTSAEIHVSVHKALRIAGIGASAVTAVPTDDRGRLRADALPPLGPRTLVVLQAGNVNGGHCDPFAEVIPQARAAGAWVHVDGAFGLWAAAAPARAHLVAGVEGADSWATDAHKWLNAPYDAGIVLCARRADLRRAMAVDAAYLTDDAERAAMHLGVQMSQRARGIETWAVLAARGREGVADLVEAACAHAADLARRLAAAGIEVLAPVVLNQVVVAFGDDAATEAVVDAVQADGTCWAGPTTWQGRRAMRLSVSSSATTAADVAASARAIVACRDAVVGRP